jgi:hypothetical protein
MDLKECVWEGVKKINLAVARDMSQVVVKMVRNLQVL